MSGEAVSWAWGDADAGCFGSARVEVRPGSTAAGVTASGYAVLFAGHQPTAARAAHDVELSGVLDGAEVAGVRATRREPGSAWDVSFTSDDGASGWALRFAALGPGGGGEDAEQLCRVTGVATLAGEVRAVNCLGQRGTAAGSAPAGLALTRRVSAWLADDLALSLEARRPARARSHADEAVSATLWAPVGEEGAVETLACEEARLSTTSDAQGRVHRAGIELFLHEEDPGHRAAGQVLCGTSLELREGRVDVAFFAWRMEGHTGVGRYDVEHHPA